MKTTLEVYHLRCEINCIVAPTILHQLIWLVAHDFVGAVIWINNLKFNRK